MSDTPSQGLSADDQAAFDAMREADNTPAPETGTEVPPAPETTGAETTEAPADPGTDQPGDNRQRTVPHAALHEERERRKAIEKQAAAERQQWEARFNALLQRFPQPQGAPQQQQQPPAAPPLPDPEKDPVGYLVERQNRTEQTMQQLVQAMLAERQQNQQRTAQEQALDALRTSAQAMEQQFVAETPDYNHAANFLAETRHKELAAAGWDDPAERLQMIRNEALGLAHRAIQMGRNPAQMVYEIAKLKGYQAPALAAPGAANGQAPAPAPAEKLAQLAAGQEQSRTLGNARGAAPAGISAQTVMNMSQKEFDSFLSKATPDQMAAVFGS